MSDTPMSGRYAALGSPVPLPRPLLRIALLVLLIVPLAGCRVWNEGEQQEGL